MWFVGMLVGAVIGAIGNGGGTVIGGIVGIILGAIIGSKLKQGRAADARITKLEEALRTLTARVAFLENGAITRPVVTATADSEPRADMVMAATPPVPAVPAPVVDATSAAALIREAGAQPATGVVAAPEPALSQPMARAPAVSTVPSAPKEPSKPSEPSALWKFFFGGNTLVRVGILVLFIGVSFLLKYAVDAGFVPIELRLAGVAAGGIALLVVGWRLRHKRADYALMLQGGGVGFYPREQFVATNSLHMVGQAIDVRLPGVPLTALRDAAGGQAQAVRLRFRALGQVAIAAGLPKPAIYVIPDADPNAFATGSGPERASIARTML